MAARAVLHRHCGAGQRLRQPLRTFSVMLQQVVSHALGRLDTNPGQTPQRVDQAFEAALSHAAAVRCERPSGWARRAQETPGTCRT
jgi:hypothetical protein